MKLILIIFITVSIKSYGFIDAFVDVADKVADTTAIVSATSELSKEIDQDNRDLEDVQKRMRDLREKQDKTIKFGRDTSSLLEGPNLRASALDRKIYSATSYIKTLKHYYATYMSGTVSAKGVSAVEEIRKSSEQVKQLRREAQDDLDKQEKEVADVIKKEETRQKDIEFRKKQNDLINSLIVGN